MKIRPVILTGGSGTRLWPLSRKNFPKPYIPLFGKKTLLELTIERVMLSKNFLNPIIVCNKNHNFIIQDIIKKINLEATIISEPESRGTAAAVYLAALYVSSNENLLIIPSDHFYSDYQYLEALWSKIDKINDLKNWILFGVKPYYPSSEFGYIEVDINKKTNIQSFSKNLYEVKSFKEKPTVNNAKNYLKKNNFFWNSGMFLGNSKMIIENYKNKSPQLANSCEMAFECSKFDEIDKIVSFESESFKKIFMNSIDFEIIEKSKNLKVLVLDCEWNDLGTWDAISKLTKTKKNKKIISINSRNNFINHSNKLIATIDINDCIIVDTDDALLISKKESSHKVPKILNKISKKYTHIKNDNIYESRPWGNFEILNNTKNYKVKKLFIKPFSRLSLQYHNFRSEHWVVLQGNATVHLEGKIIKLKKGESIDIPKGKKHFLANMTNKNLIIIETQLGTYFGEDDIIRLDDPYKR